MLEEEQTEAQSREAKLSLKAKGNLTFAKELRTKNDKEEGLIKGIDRFA